MVDDTTYTRTLPDGTKITETVFGHPKVMKIKEITEAPLPPDWDPAEFKQNTTSFKSRLAYALDRAQKLGTGSSRVATLIEFEGRQTVLKIAKNGKGLAQNHVEVSILDDGYASQLGILIPLIDYDKENRDPLWIQTEMAQKANEKQLCALMKCPSLQILVNYAWSITGKKRFMGLPDVFINGAKERGLSDDDIETYSDYASVLADLASSFDIELGDFTRAANWGIFQGKPVIIDAGFTTDVNKQHYS
jgi:hypothetical protein